MADRLANQPPQSPSAPKADFLSRLAGSIYLQSPESKREWRLPWRGNDWTAEKRLGKYASPKVDGTVVQDLGLSGLEAPITLLFEGADCDKESWAFAICAAERGPWKVTHPVRGDLSLQLAGLTIHDSIDSLGLIAVDTTWINPAPAKTFTSSAQLAGAIAASVENTNIAAAAQYSKLARTIAKLSSAYASLKKYVAVVKHSMQVAQTAADTISNQITKAIDDLSDDVESIAGMTEQLIESPGIYIGSLGNSISALGSVVVNIYESVVSLVTPDAPTDTEAAAVASAELVAVSAFAALGQLVTTTAPATKGEAVAAIETILSLWGDTVAAFDEVQTLYASLGLTERYFSQTETYATVNQLIAHLIEYLLSIIADLKTEVRFTLGRARHPLELAIALYGKDGWDDSYFDLFIKTNNLHGDELFLLPAGREVVAYE